MHGGVVGAGAFPGVGVRVRVRVQWYISRDGRQGPFEAGQVRETVQNLVRSEEVAALSPLLSAMFLLAPRMSVSQRKHQSTMQSRQNGRGERMMPKRRWCRVPELGGRMWKGRSTREALRSRRPGAPSV